MAIEIDESDPCEAARLLRQAHLQMVAGQTAAEIRFRAGPNGVERSVSFSKGDPNQLLKLIRGYETQCAALNGRRSRRFSLASGGRF